MTGVWLSENEQQAWRTYLRVGSLLPAALNRQLQQDCGLTLPEYEVLVALSEAAPQHVAAVRRLVFDRLSGAQLAAFEQACSVILDALAEEA